MNDKMTAVEVAFVQSWHAAVYHWLNSPDSKGTNRLQPSINRRKKVGHPVPEKTEKPIDFSSIGGKCVRKGPEPGAPEEKYES
jgi:hypothetical protein